ncbi:MAG: hypothetical protein ABTB30_17845 [Clostridia bacterium]
MEENRKNDQEIRKLDPEQLEQVSGGLANPTKSKFCGVCRDTTTWIFVNGVWLCGKCAHGPGCQIVV